jgi:hypothetical protein
MHPPARSGQLRIGRDVQHGLGAVSHPVQMSSERLAFIWLCIFCFSTVPDMHPSLRILKLIAIGKKCSPPELIQAFGRRRTHAGKAVIAGHTRHAIVIKDHDRVKDLFDRFEKEDSGAGRRRSSARRSPSLRSMPPSRRKSSTRPWAGSSKRT